MLNTLKLVIWRDVLLTFRRRSETANTIFFFVIATTLFPLGVGPDKALLRTIAPGILWTAALLASILSLDRLFALDYADGTLEQMILSAEPLTVIVLGKVVAHWLTSGLPIVILAPFLGLQFDLTFESIAVLLFSLLIGTPILSFLGAIGAALTLGARGGSVLITLLVLPLYIPVLIFGAGAVVSHANGLESDANFLLLSGLLAGVAAIAPCAASAALRISHQ